MDSKKPWRLLTVERLDSPTRLDVWLASKVEGLSRRRAKLLIENGEVSIDGETAKKSASIKQGNKVEIRSEPTPVNWIPAAEPGASLEVIFLDRFLLAVDKPSGIASVPLSPSETGSLANALAARFPECAGIGRSPGDAGLVQRLDRETSGAMLAARTAEVYDRLLSAQKRGDIVKKYTALVRAGSRELPEVIDLPLAPAGRGRTMVMPAKNGVAARTELKVIESHGDRLLIEATIHTGQRHQIRSHLAAAGFPIAGDMRYGDKKMRPELGRLFLHASELRFNHPVEGEPTIIQSPLPPELMSFIDSLP